jgi:serine/threonine-protein kinase
MIGSKLAHYEITSHLGTGGMGEVYQATDSKLGRSVAIKLLAEAFTHDAERASRFEREARVLASLNHPNIATIHGVEESSGRKFLVMELVSGETLAEKIKRGAIPLDESLSISTQITEALEAAHEKGVIHRDLKPANIKVTPDGKVKVLDFGLAKAYDANPSNASLSNSPTMASMAATNAGIILGTAAYMSPEQAKGREVDRRTDIFAFGAVLYEMLTGHQAFGGDDVADILSAVLKSEPDWTRLPKETPSGIRKLLRRCLEKNMKNRHRDAGEVRINIEEALAEPLPIPTDVAAPQKRSSAPWAVAAVLAVTLVLVAWAPWRSDMTGDRPLVQLDVDLGADVSFPAPGVEGSSFAISPDGMRLAYVSGSPTRLFTRRLDQPKAVEPGAMQGALMPFFSPDGQWIGFAADNKLNKISVEGGAVVFLGALQTLPNGASWSEDGSILAAEPFNRGLLRVPAAGGTPEVMAPLGNSELSLATPQMLPGGKAVLISPIPSNLGARSVELLTLSDRNRKVVARGGTGARYLATGSGTGHLIYINNATLFAVRFDLDKLEARGTAVPILDDIAYSTSNALPQIAISPGPTGHGTLVYRKATGGGSRFSTVDWVDASGTKPLRAKPGMYTNTLSLSPDGKRLAVAEAGASGIDVWIYDPQRDAMTRSSFGGVNRSPRLEPGRSVHRFHAHWRRPLLDTR